MRKILLAFVALTLALAGARATDNCTTETLATLETPAGTYYVYVGDCMTDGSCIFSVWIYEETNGKPGLQRCDEIWIECCDGTVEGDTIIF